MPAGNFVGDNGAVGVAGTRDVFGLKMDQEAEVAISADEKI